MIIERPKDSGVIILAAGGTGGHMFPAQALAEELTRRGFIIHLMTDVRGWDYSLGFASSFVHVISSGTLQLRRPLMLISGILRIAWGIIFSLFLMIRLKPCVVIGFGGYPSFPPLFAAWLLRLPTCIHEQNAIMGRANRFLGKHVDAVAFSFSGTMKLGKGKKTMQVYIGNPVRSAVIAASSNLYELPEKDGVFRLLVFGGSQGARVFSDVVPAAVASLDFALRQCLHIVHQVRSEFLEETRRIYENLGISFELSTFFVDIPERMASSHLVIARSGATTISELALLGCPSILVPLASTLDNDQGINAMFMEKMGAAWIIPQVRFTPTRLADDLGRLMRAPGDLGLVSKAARSLSRPKAALQFADLVESLSKNKARKRLSV